MTHARTDDTPSDSGRKGLFAGLTIAVAVILTIAVVASMFLGSSNQGHGAELNKQALRDSLSPELAEGWNSEMCFVLMDKPRGLADAPAELPAINCLLDDGSQNGVSTTMVADEKFAEAVRNTDMVGLGSSADGAHEVSWLPETGLIYDVTEQSVLRFGPHPDEAAARAFAESHGMLEAE